MIQLVGTVLGTTTYILLCIPLHMQGLVEVMGTNNSGYNRAYFWHLKLPAAGCCMNTTAICLAMKKTDRREVKCCEPLQSKTKGQDAALRQQAAPRSCQGAAHRGALSPTQGQGAHQALPVCAPSDPLQLGNSLEPPFLWEQGK